MGAMRRVPGKELFTSLFTFSAGWCRALNGDQAPEEKVWQLPQGHIKEEHRGEDVEDKKGKNL